MSSGSYWRLADRTHRRDPTIQQRSKTTSGLLPPSKDLADWKKLSASIERCAPTVRVSFGRRIGTRERAKHGLADVLDDRGRELTAQALNGGIYRIYGGAATMADHEGKNELQQALACFQEALGLVDGDQDPGFYGIIWHDIGDTYRARGDREQAAAAYQEAVTYKRKRLPRSADGLAVTMETFCDFLIDGDELTEARTILDQLGEVLPQIADPEELAAHVHSVGRAYERLATKGQEQDYAEALRYYTQAAGLVDRDKTPGFYGVVLHDIGDVHRARGDQEQAAAAYREAVTYKRKRLPDNAGDLARTMEVLSDFLISIDDLTEARTILDQLNEVLPQIVDRAERAGHMNTVGRGYLVLGERGQEDAYTEALRAHKNALEIVDVESDPASYATILKSIGDVYEAQHKLGDARAAYEQAVQNMRHVQNAKSDLASMLLDLGRIQRQLGIRRGKDGEDKDGS